MGGSGDPDAEDFLQVDLDEQATELVYYNFSN